MKACCKCNQPPKPRAEDPTGRTELRPYGPDGAPICFTCATADPETSKAVDAQIHRAFDNAEEISYAISGRRIAIITEDGIKPIPGSGKA